MTSLVSYQGEDKYSTQNDLLLTNLLKFYENEDNLSKMLNIITGESQISLRIVDWFVTNYAKMNFTVYTNPNTGKRVNVHVQYKLKLKSYSKRRLDPFARWNRLTIKCGNNQFLETTLGQLNFFRWSIENYILEYIEQNYADIEQDMILRNSTSKRKEQTESSNGSRKRREELSVSASKSIKKENIEIVVNFN